MMDLRVASIGPVNGPTAGGTTVTIRGYGFVAGATVTIGGVAATGVSVTSPTSLTAVTGAHATGLVDVTVNVPTAPYPATLAQSFFYFPPPIPTTGLFTVPPCRLFDTRTSVGSPALAPYEKRVWTATGRCGVPASAKALVLNVAVTGPTTGGYIQLAPGNGLTESSALNFKTGLTRANNAIAMLATDGAGTLAVTNRSAGTTHVILDVSGYFE